MKPLLILMLCLFSGCASSSTSSPKQTLVGSQWQLVSYVDASGEKQTPDNPEKYIMRLEENNRLSLTLNCNRGMGTWSAFNTRMNEGDFDVSPVAMTKAFCLPPSMDELIARKLSGVSSYEFKMGELRLKLSDDEYIAWQRIKGTAK